jgi:fermentation-respiration switch protein FrsA (DUF1100 family)
MIFYSPKRKGKEILLPPPEVKSEKDKAAMNALIEELLPLPCEEVQITAFDGTLLYGLYYHERDGAPLQILFHGYKGLPKRDLCGGSMLAREKDHNHLLVYHRAHGKSGGHTITFGVKERRDCLSWVDYAVKRFGEDVTIYLSGVSMGASTVLMAAELGLPKQVKAIVADSPFTTPDAIIKKVTESKKIPTWLAMPFIRLGAKLFGGFSTRGASAVEGVKKADVPVLLIHGEADAFVPFAMRKEIYDGREDTQVTLFSVKDADHAICFLVDAIGYLSAVTKFYNKLDIEKKAL